MRRTNDDVVLDRNGATVDKKFYIKAIICYVPIYYHSIVKKDLMNDHIALKLLIKIYSNNWSVFMKDLQMEFWIKYRWGSW